LTAYCGIEDRQRGVCLSEDRQGTKIFCPLISPLISPLIRLSIGIVKVGPGKFYSHHQIAAAAAEAKKKKKKKSPATACSSTGGTALHL